jgi:hypothetical protein
MCNSTMEHTREEQESTIRQHIAALEESKKVTR